MTRGSAVHTFSLREVQSLLGVSRRALQILIDAGFVQPSRGARNDLRFTFREVVLLRTALKLRGSRIPPRRVLQALSRIKDQLPDVAPLSGVRITAVGDAVAVTAGAAQWDAVSGQLLLDFEVADVKGDVTFLDRAPTSQSARRKQAQDWYSLAEQLQATDAVGAEAAYRKAIELSPEPDFHAYNNLGALLAGDSSRCGHALKVFDEALKHFADAELLHANRAVVLEEMGRLEDAAASYLRCVEINEKNDQAAFEHALLLEKLRRYEEAMQAYARCLDINPGNEEALRHLTELHEQRGDTRAVIRHLSAWRRSNG
ncbi:tetratricopeptide (TPR) repeat protein [Paraburkholderia sp. UCT70]